MKNKELIYNMALEEAEKLKMNGYQTRFLASMVLRKYRHRRENMIQLATKVMKVMPERYTEKKNLTAVSAKKSLDDLEIALNDSTTIDEDWLSGQTVSHVVKKMVMIIGEELGEKITEEELRSDSNE